jgi:hypothetical protein
MKNYKSYGNINDVFGKSVLRKLELGIGLSETVPPSFYPKSHGIPLKKSYCSAAAAFQGFLS